MVFKVVLVLAYWQPFEFQAAVFEHKMLTFRLQESDDVLPISSCLRRDAYEEIQTSREEDVQLLSIHFLFPSHEQQMSKKLFTRDSTNCYGLNHFWVNESLTMTLRLLRTCQPDGLARLNKKRYCRS